MRGTTAAALRGITRGKLTPMAVRWRHTLIGPIPDLISTALSQTLITNQIMRGTTAAALRWVTRCKLTPITVRRRHTLIGPIPNLIRTTFSQALIANQIMRGTAALAARGIRGVIGATLLARSWRHTLALEFNFWERARNGRRLIRFSRLIH